MNPYESPAAVEDAKPSSDWFVSACAFTVLVLFAGPPAIAMLIVLHETGNKRAAESVIAAFIGNGLIFVWWLVLISFAIAGALSCICS